MILKGARQLVRGVLGVGAVAMLAMPAHATEGYFALGYGPVQRGQGGAGVAAKGTNAMASTINPAAVASMGQEFSLGLEVFSPHRGYSASGTTMVFPGDVRSARNLFLVPNFAYNMPLANGAVLNFAAYGNGGMDTSYPAVANPGCPSPGGIFCGGTAGVDLNQLFLSVTYAQKVGNVSFGIAPTLAAQAFKAWGIGAFGAMSQDASALSDNGIDYSTGFGLRAGLQAEISPVLSVGVTAQSKMSMSKLKKYAGLFAESGGFDIPPSATVGLAWKASPGLSLLADYQRIWYSQVASVSNPSVASAPLGAPNGPGFGWKDVSVIKLGAVWAQSPKMTWRFGYAHSTNPVQPQDVLLNILAPGVVKDHFTVGGTWKASQRDSVDFALMYVPKTSVTGAVPAAYGGGTVKLDMHQWSGSIGWTRRF